MRYAFRVQYIGKNYAGSQLQLEAGREILPTIQGELEKATGFTLEKEEFAPQVQAFARAKAKTPLQNDENRLQNAPRDPDEQGDPSGEDALVEALSGLFEKSLAEAAAEAVEKEEKQDEE